MIDLNTLIAEIKKAINIGDDHVVIETDWKGLQSLKDQAEILLKNKEYLIYGLHPLEEILAMTGIGEGVVNLDYTHEYVSDVLYLLIYWYFP